MSRTFPLLIAFIVGNTGDSGDPTPDKVFGKPVIVAALNKVVDIKATLPGGVSYAWAVPEQDGIDFRHSGLTGFVFPRTAGSYCIGLAYGSPIQMAWVTVKVGMGVGEPPPVPQILPPVPSSEKGAQGPKILTLVVVYEKIPTLPPFSGYQPLTDTMLAKGHKWKLVDKDGRDSRGALVVDSGRYLSLIKGKTLPCLIIVDQVGTLWGVQALPNVAEDMVKTLQTAEG